MVRELPGGVRQEVDGNMDGSYMVLLLFVPTASIFAKISNIDNGGGNFDKLSDCNPCYVGYK